MNNDCGWEKKGKTKKSDKFWNSDHIEHRERYII